MYRPKATVELQLVDPNAKLTVDDPASSLYTGINTTGNGILKDTFYIRAAYEGNDHRAAVRAVGEYWCKCT